MLANDEETAKGLNKSIFPGIQGGPYAKRVVGNAETLANILKEEGATLVSGGTDNHLILIDVRPLGLTGEGMERLGRCIADALKNRDDPAAIARVREQTAELAGGFPLFSRG